MPRKSTATHTKRSTTSTEPYSELLAYREQFPILQRKIYLNSCSLGTLSLRGMAGMTRFQELWNEHGAQAWYELWMGELDALRRKFARLINAQPHEVAIAPSVSVALGEIASALEDDPASGKRDHVILADMDFPTLAYQWLARRRQGTRVTFVESPDRIRLPAELFGQHITHKTRLVATSHVFYLSGYVQDIGALAQMAHAQGALLLVDDYQGTGQIPLDVKALDLDFVVTGSLKWLLGGPGVSFIYAREELLPRLRPTMTGWWASRDQFQ
ncbi:MAG TPA: aminotransferase class V-fold PLP-dependent enzyme, partial [Ktedonobacterales bacterium]|nr:aminotransferase class V-fold PLP-dependent enzyme [Ktedonobacterales bacterium]